MCERVEGTYFFFAVFFVAFLAAFLAAFAIKYSPPFKPHFPAMEVRNSPFSKSAYQGNPLA
jgi:hypothetical protein